MEASIQDMIKFIGDDPSREGVLETPARVIKSWTELYSGYKTDVASIFKVFDEQHDEMVVVRNLEFWSMCEHHMLPFFGVAHIGYLPWGKVIGLSKLGRLLDVYARRLQLQERLTNQIVLAIMTHLEPKGAGCVIEAKHLCMMCRGAMKQNSTTVTSSLRGVFKSDPTTRSEFLQLIKGTNNE